MSELISGTQGGIHVAGAALTTTYAREASPSLLVNEVDRRVTRIRPMSTPLDQISRMVGARSAKSMVVEYYAVDTKSGVVVMDSLQDVDKEVYDNRRVYLLTLSEGSLAPTDTLFVAGIRGSAPATGDDTVVSLMLYVIKQVTAQTYHVVAVNGTEQDGTMGISPRPGRGTKLVRMGRGAAELDVQTPQFEALPRKQQNFCQIFKAQLEQSAVMRLSAKEVGWQFSDQEEVAIMDMRLGMEKSYLFGVGARITNPLQGDEVMLTTGIWHQTSNTVNLPIHRLTEKDVIAMMRKAFTGESAGSGRKVLIAGSGLIEALNCLEYTRMVTSGDVVTHWGIDFSELRSKFGTLCVVHSEVFDQCGRENDGMIIDPDYITKYSFIPFKVEHLDLKKSGVRNTDALVVTEASCLVLRHPMAHLRVVGVTEDDEAEDE